MGGKKGGAETEVTEYYLSMHLGICAEADALTGLYYGEKAIWEGTAATAGAIPISKPDLFGGNKKEGGVAGNAYYLPGDAAQALPDALASRMGRTGATCPGYRGLASVFFVGQLSDTLAGSTTQGAEYKAIRAVVYLFGLGGAGSVGSGFFPKKGFYWGANTPYLRDVWARVRRAPKGLNPALATIPRSGNLSSTVNLNAVTNGASTASGGLTNGVTLSGYAPTDVLNITMPSGGTYVAWSPWGAPNISGPSTGSVNKFNVIKDGNTATDVQIGGGGPYDGYEAARAAFSGATLTGASSYTFYIKDNPSSDNSGGLSLKVAKGGQDANPAHIIHECLTNTTWGMGAPADIIDLTSFEAAAQTLYDEGFGLSMIWSRQSPIESFVTEVIDHIQATLFIDPRTGKFTLKLIRDDYDPETLPVLTPDNCRVASFQRKGFSETINEIVVTWTNPDNEQDETVSTQDLANITVHGPISDSRNYYGVRTSDLAMRLATRDLRQAAAPLATFDLRVNREAWDFVPGGVVKLVYPEYGINGVVLRIGKIDYGKPGASEITVSATEDIFGQPSGDYNVPQTGQWIDPSQDPTPAEHVRVLTTPLYFVQLALGADEADQATYPDVTAGVLAATANADADSYELITETTSAGGDTVIDTLGLRQMMSYATLATELTAEASSLVAGFPSVAGPVVPTVSTFLFIGDADEPEQEIAVIADVDGTGFTLRRGLLDTVPRAWPAGTPVWFGDESNDFIDDTPRAAGETVTYNLLTRTSRGMLDLASAPDETATLSERPWLPNRPANVQVEGEGFAEVDASDLTEVTVTWANRNRLLEPVEALAWTDGDITPEAGQTTTVTLLDAADSSVITTIDDLTGTSYLLDLTLFGAIDTGIVRVTAKRDGLESLQGHEIVVHLTARLLLSGDESPGQVKLSGDEDGDLLLSGDAS